jgi:lactate dehydrogenase-like 2-hydroxyacid dehydrogenase
MAGLDVCEGEPRLNPAYLVVLLPHLGSASVSTRDAMGFLALEGIAAVLARKQPKNRVD